MKAGQKDSEAETPLLDDVNGDEESEPKDRWVLNWRITDACYVIV